MNKTDFCGIEVSAEKLVVAVQRGGTRQPQREFANTPSDHQALCRCLLRAGRPVRVCLESTGVYGLDLALALSRHPGLEVMVANPRAVRHFATALMRRSKTDPLDAEVLVEFAARMPFLPWRAPSPAALALHALARRLAALTEMHQEEKSRLHAARVTETTPTVVLRDLERSLRGQQRALARLTREALKVIAQDPHLQLRFQLLLTAHGIAETSAVQILAELAMLSPDLDVRQWVAYAGLDPRHYTSGSSLHRKTRISKTGNRHLRRALYMPALVAVRHEPHLRAFYAHLLGRGKLKMQALVAVMRKLLHAIYGMFRHALPFDGSKAYRLPQEAPLGRPASSTTEAA
jgi:transposase